MVSFLDPLYAMVGGLISLLHQLLGGILDNGGGVTWAVSIVILTMIVRIIVFPLFVKQIRSQRAMTKLQPELKVLQDKYKGDRQAFGEASMKLYKERGVNPLSGCLPILLQAPAFIALYGVLSQLRLNNTREVPGLSKELVDEGAVARIFGTPIAAGFNVIPKGIEASMTSVNLVTTAMILLMGLTTFLSARQMMKRASKQGTQMMGTAQQKAMLYAMPIMLIAFGFIAHFPLGVLIYMLTSNCWTFAQQHFVIGAMDRRDEARTSAAAAATPTKRKRGESAAEATPPVVTPPAGGPLPGLRPGEAGRTRKRPPNSSKGK